jgi:hypothetical protein
MAYLMNILLTSAPELARSFVSMFGAPQYSGELPLNNPMARQQQQDAMRETLKSNDKPAASGSASNVRSENIFSRLMGNRTNPT